MYHFTIEICIENNLSIKHLRKTERYSDKDNTYSPVKYTDDH